MPIPMDVSNSLVIGERVSKRSIKAGVFLISDFVS